MQILRNLFGANRAHEQAREQALRLAEYVRSINVIRIGERQYFGNQLLSTRVSDVLKDESLKDAPELYNLLLHIAEHGALQAINTMGYEFGCDISTTTGEPVHATATCTENEGIIVKLGSKPLLDRVYQNPRLNTIMCTTLHANESFEKVKDAFRERETLKGRCAQTIRMRLAECGQSDASQLPLPTALKDMVNNVHILTKNQDKGVKSQSR